MREGLKLIRRLGSTAPISKILKSETTPGPSVNTDEEWEAWMVGQAHTEFHPMGTCAMLPLAQGGVVNAKLQVYGLGAAIYILHNTKETNIVIYLLLANVRVADASVYPFEFSSHVSTLSLPCHCVASHGTSFCSLALQPMVWRNRPHKSSVPSITVSPRHQILYLNPRIIQLIHRRTVRLRPRTMSLCASYPFLRLHGLSLHSYNIKPTFHARFADRHQYHNLLFPTPFLFLSHPDVLCSAVVISMGAPLYGTLDRNSNAKVPFTSR